MIADTIKHLREQLGYTQAQLAKKLNITRSSVNAWEMGISVPSTQFVVELAALFHVSTDYLLGVSREKTLCIDHLSQEQAKVVRALVACFEAEKK